MDKEILEYWQHQASIPEKDEIDALRRVLDPYDIKGIKNSYIDLYLKHYLQEYLQPQPSDNVLEIGCGTGRLSEYISCSVNAAYGIDITDNFIETCRSRPNKRDNSHYLSISELEQLKHFHINKLFIVWVLMYLTDREEILETLRRYRDSLPVLNSAIVIEQVKNSAQTRYRAGRMDCHYRTIEDYYSIFSKAGFSVEGHVVLGERYLGPLYRLIHMMGNILPGNLKKYSEDFFRFDRKMLGHAESRKMPRFTAKPIDVVFKLEAS